MSEDQELQTQTVDAVDKNAPALNLLSFFIPLIGAILYLMNKDDYPIKARGIGRSALSGFIYFLAFIIFKALISSR